MKTLIIHKKHTQHVTRKAAIIILETLHIFNYAVDVHQIHAIDDFQNLK